MRRYLILLTIISLTILPVWAQRTTTTDVLQTIPPIIVSGPNAIALCTVLNVTPGSVVAGTTGFLKANCPNNQPAIDLRGTETPTFVLATGWQQIVLMTNGYPCSFSFRVVPFPNEFETVGTNMTSGTSITFINTTPVNSTSLTVGGYEYCLYFSNPPINGLATFTIAWSP